jgi:hypothetical protein
MPCAFVDENEAGSRFRTKEVENAQIKPSIFLVREKSLVSSKKSIFFEKLSRTWVWVWVWIWVWVWVWVWVWFWV